MSKLSTVSARDNINEANIKGSEATKITEIQDLIQGLDSVISSLEVNSERLGARLNSVLKGSRPIESADRRETATVLGDQLSEAITRLWQIYHNNDAVLDRIEL